MSQQRTRNKEPGNVRHYHFVGVGGVGMSAVAQAVLAPGVTVSGSDRDRDAGKGLPVLGKLLAAGIELLPQDGSGVSSETTAVIASTAIEADNPDLAAAERLRVPVWHRSEMLAKLVAPHTCVAITGTSGKSTVTGMVGWLLSEMGMDPTVVNGAPVVNWCTEKQVGNVRKGASDLWVIEADESDRSLLNFVPDYAVITNVSADHFTLEASRDLFAAFAGKVKAGQVNPIRHPQLLAGFSPDVNARGSSFEYKDLSFSISLPGRHNAENAFLAVLLCEMLGCDLEAIRDAWEGFRGICRRLEKVGERNGVTVIDDYGHNPAKIEAAWKALAPYHERVLAVWRPHGYGPLRAMMNELVTMFSSVMRSEDRLYVLPVYDAGGTADRSISSDMLVDALAGKGLSAISIADYGQVLAQVPPEARSGDAVVVMGARDPDLPALARNLLASIR